MSKLTALVDALTSPVPDWLPESELPPADYVPNPDELTTYIWVPPYPSTITDADLADYESALGRPLSAEHRELLQYKHFHLVEAAVEWSFERLSWLAALAELANADSARAKMVAKGWVPLAEWEDGGFYGLDYTQDGEPPVIAWHPENPQSVIPVAPSLSAWFQAMHDDDLAGMPE